MKLTHELIHVPTARAFKIATGASTAFAFTIVRIEHEGVVGFGEASPATRVTGETPESVARFLDAAAKELAGRAPSEWRAFLERVHEDPANPGARAGLDLALHDLAGKLQDAPARALHDLPSARLETCMTVSLDAPEAMAEEAREYRKRGFRVLKLKLGEAARDLTRVEAVKEAVPDARLRADANTGWSPADANALAPRLADLGVEFLEQPFLPAADNQMAALSQRSPLVIFADESVKDARDVERLHAMGFRGGVNLKLQKTGGILPAVAAARRAKELGYQVQLGCNIETAIGIAAGVQMLSLLDYADLDGHLLLGQEPFVGPRPREGWYETPDAPGLGVRAG